MIQPFAFSLYQEWFLNRWNHEFRNDFPLSFRIIQEKIMESNDVCTTYCFGCFHHDVLLGIIVLKHFNDRDISSDLNISLIFVEQMHRNQGIGKSLIQHAIQFAHQHGFSKIIVGADYNCLFSGVFICHNRETHRFFLNNGFTKLYKNVNLIANKAPEVLLHQSKFHIVTQEQEKQAILTLIQNYFSKRWYLDVCNASPNELIACYDENLIGFLRMNHMGALRLSNSLNLHSKYENLGGIGPLGMIPSKQKMGYGKQMVRFALSQLFQMGCSDVIVDWTGLVDFYKSCGFHSVSQEYIIYQYNLFSGGSVI